jgi:Zn finger protein HypA/HybF involved in hydrogenase expression
VIHLNKKEEKWEVKAKCSDCGLQMTLITKNIKALIKGSIPDLEKRCPNCGMVFSDQIIMQILCPECNGANLIVSQVMPLVSP